MAEMSVRPKINKRYPHMKGEKNFIKDESPKLKKLRQEKKGSHPLKIVKGHENIKIGE
jgi:hypothetical protein